MRCWKGEKTARLGADARATECSVDYALYIKDIARVIAINIARPAGRNANRLIGAKMDVSHVGSAVLF